MLSPQGLQFVTISISNPKRIILLSSEQINAMALCIYVCLVFFEREKINAVGSDIPKLLFFKGIDIEQKAPKT